MRSISIIVVLAPALFGVLPTWPYSNNWGFFPSVVIGLVLTAAVALSLAGQREPPP